MTSFNELSAIIKFFKGRPLIKDIPLQLERPPKSKLEAFYQGIALGKYKDDADAAKSLYGQHQNHASYRRLKERLFDKLILQLFLINFDYKGFSIESRNYFKNLVNLVSMRIILGIGNYFIPIELAKQGVKYATKSQQSEIGFLVSTAYSTLLREYPVSRENTLSVKIDQLSNTFFENLLIEIKIDKCFGIIVENLQKGGKQNAKEIGHAYETLLSTENKLDKVNALKKVRFYYAKAVVNGFEMKFEDAIKICDSGFEKVKKSKITSIHVIILLKVQCLIHLNKFNEALKSLKLAEKRNNIKGHNLAPFSELYFFIHTRSGNYEYALQEYDKAISGNFLSQSQIYFESWRQYGLLLLFLIKLDKIPPSELLERLKPKLRLGKLLNEMPEYSKDKAGLNLAIRILHVLILLTSKKFEEFEEALVPLQSYIQRYKRHHPEIFRCDLMVKMLSLIPRVHYDAARTSWRARPFLEKMLVPPEQLPLKVTEMEVIPYEKMWDYVIEFLGTLKRRPYSSKAAD